MYSTTFIFDVEKYGIRVERNDALVVLLGNESSRRSRSQGHGTTIWSRFMSACMSKITRNDHGVAFRSNTRQRTGDAFHSQNHPHPHQHHPTMTPQTLMTMDESRPHPLVPNIDALLLAFGSSLLLPTLPKQTTPKHTPAPSFWTRRIQNGSTTANSYHGQQDQQSISVNRSATLNEEDVRRLKVMAERMATIVDSTSSKENTERNTWLVWLHGHAVVSRLINFACEYQNMVKPVCDVLVLLLLLPMSPSFTPTSPTPTTSTPTSSSSSTNEPSSQILLQDLLSYLDYVLLEHLGVVDHVQLSHLLMLLSELLSVSSMTDLRNGIRTQHLNAICSICSTCLVDDIMIPSDMLQEEKDPKNAAAFNEEGENERRDSTLSPLPSDILQGEMTDDNGQMAGKVSGGSGSGSSSGKSPWTQQRRIKHHRMMIKETHHHHNHRYGLRRPPIAYSNIVGSRKQHNNDSGLLMRRSRSHTVGTIRLNTSLTSLRSSMNSSIASSSDFDTLGTPTRLGAGKRDRDQKRKKIGEETKRK